MENIYEIDYRVSINETDVDVIIVSINSDGFVQNFNENLYNANAYRKDILKSLDIKKGFDIKENYNNKTYIYVVTSSKDEENDILKMNLENALDHYSFVLFNKKIWITLMSNSHNYNDVLKMTKSIILNFVTKHKNQSRFIISLPKGSNEFMEHYKFNKNHDLKDSYSLINTLNNFENNNDLLQNIISRLNFYFVYSYNNKGNDLTDYFYENNIWENYNKSKELLEILDKVEKGSIFLNIGHNANKINFKGIGIVTKITKDTYQVNVKWIYKFSPYIAIDGFDLYSDPISLPKTDDLIDVLSSIDLNEFSKNYIKIIDEIKKESNIPLAIEMEGIGLYSRKNTTTIPGIAKDTDNGEDYLDIKGDVNAFARVIAAKSFEPPLAIALLGKWGSGKSFFMRKLKDNIQTLSERNPDNAFCQGVAHVHFNAWSYMDANLWASIVTRIFEGLNEYISGDSLAETNKKEIEKKLTQNLNFSKEEISSLEKQTKTINTQLFGLYRQKINAKLELKKKVATIKQNTLEKILKNINEKFKVEETINKSLAENPTFIKSTNELENIIPKKYWISPEELYNQACSKYTFIKAFFKKGTWLRNTIWLIAILMIVYLTPIFTFIVSLLASWQDFSFTAKTLSFLLVFGNFWKRAVDTYNKLQPLIASFWKIKEDYESAKTEALFKFNQKEKALNIEILNNKEEINRIDEQIVHIKEVKEKIEFKLKSALSTEALYTFIEKRANSDDYKKHLGIVSLIRKDFEILSGLLTGHHTELISNKDSNDFKKLFNNPLERIILYIDDLDRCPEDRVVEVLEAVNLLMAFPLFVVVVGVDPRWVKTALQKKYKNQFTKEKENEDEISPSNYLEKIFQVPFHLKDAGDASIKNMIKTLAQAKPNIVRLLNEESPLIESPQDGPNLNLDYYEIETPSENEFKVNTNIFDNLFNKETIEALEITERESKLMQDMSKIIGNNPRAIKRFVNIYRIVKTHEDFNNSIRIDDDYNLLTIFLLALSIGEFKTLIPSFEDIINEYEEKTNTLAVFLTPSTETNNKDDQKRREKAKRLYNLLPNERKNLIEIENKYIKNRYQFIKRFTFKNI